MKNETVELLVNAVEDKTKLHRLTKIAVKEGRNVVYDMNNLVGQISLRGNPINDSFRLVLEFDNRAPMADHREYHGMTTSRILDAKFADHNPQVLLIETVNSLYRLEELRDIVTPPNDML